MIPMDGQFGTFSQLEPALDSPPQATLSMLLFKLSDSLLTFKD